MPITLWSHLIWLLAITLGSFLVTWIFTDLLHVTRTVYIGVLTVVTAGFFFGYMSWSNTDWGAFMSYHWIWGLVGAAATGAIFIALLARVARGSKLLVLVYRPRPEGLHLFGALLWESVVYGAAEALLLSVLPALVAWQTLSALGWTQSWMGVVFSGVLALGASEVVIVAHHLGYREFRGPQIVEAVGACGILSLSFLLTLNPLAAVGGHIILHAGYVLLGIELPPHQEMRGHAVETMIPART
jgi:hypothetical protein